MRFDPRWPWQGISLYHDTVTRVKRKNRDGAGSPARLRKDGRYEARATLNTTTGRRRVSFYGATVREAEDERLQALAEQAKGIIFSDPGQLTVADYLQAWLMDTARYQVRDSTFNRYEQIVRNHLRPFFDRLRLRDLTPAHVRAFKARSLDAGLHPNTVGGMQGVLSGALNQAVDDRLIPSNPAARVKKAAARGERPMRSLTQEEASRLVAAAVGSRYEALIVVALRTGMRQGELAALKWQDIDLEGPRTAITVRHSADTRISPPQITPTKTGKDRRVRIGPRTVEVLRAHRAHQRFERMRARSWEFPDLVFPNTSGEVRRSGAVRKSLRRLLKKAGLPEPGRVRFHDLRHTAGTLALRQGMTLHAVSKMLGHADPAMTLRRYAHVLDDMEDEGGRAMDELF
jgi:integrase